MLHDKVSSNSYFHFDIGRTALDLGNLHHLHVDVSCVSRFYIFPKLLLL
jgi:hypothetical protein